jgi:hypothetical protein
MNISQLRKIGVSHNSDFLGVSGFHLSGLRVTRQHGNSTRSPLFSQLAFPVAGLLKDPSSLSEEEAGQIGKEFHKTLLILPLHRKAL